MHRQMMTMTKTHGVSRGAAARGRSCRLACSAIISKSAAQIMASEICERRCAHISEALSRSNCLAAFTVRGAVCALKYGGDTFGFTVFWSVYGGELAIDVT